jgi:hypothetical protein
VRQRAQGWSRDYPTSEMRARHRGAGGGAECSAALTAARVGVTRQPVNSHACTHCKMIDYRLHGRRRGGRGAACYARRWRRHGRGARRGRRGWHGGAALLLRGGGCGHVIAYLLGERRRAASADAPGAPVARRHHRREPALRLVPLVRRRRLFNQHLDKNRITNQRKGRVISVIHAHKLINISPPPPPTRSAQTLPPPPPAAAQLQRRPRPSLAAASTRRHRGYG